MECPCFISSQALLSCGALERARSTFKLASSSKSFWQEAVSTVRGTGFGALGANAFRPLGRDLGMPKGSHGGTWAIRPSIVLLKLLARRWLGCFGEVPAGRQFILSAVAAKTFRL